MAVRASLSEQRSCPAGTQWVDRSDRGVLVVGSEEQGQTFPLEVLSDVNDFNHGDGSLRPARRTAQTEVCTASFHVVCRPQLGLPSVHNRAMAVERVSTKNFLGIEYRKL